MSTMLEVKNIEVAYGKIVAVKDVSLTVNQGEIVTLVGSNGAGKSTTLRTISGLSMESQGTQSSVLESANLLKVAASSLECQFERTWSWVHSFAMTRLASLPIWSESLISSHVFASVSNNVPERCRVASSRCLLSVER
jgi:ABC-type branched-subunit amino acid transport system ATPase component